MALGATTAITDIANLEAQGKSAKVRMYGIASGGITAATSNCGNISQILTYNSVGTTLYSALQDIPIQGGLTSSPLRLKSFIASANRATPIVLVRTYKIGTVNLATGVFTHDAATFPINKTQMGSSQAIDLIPIMQITTATATTAPAYTFTYTNQDGGSVTGTITNTLPAAATAVGGCYLMRLEIGDTAVRDISAMSFSATGSAGAATIWGLEQYAMVNPFNNTVAASKNAMFKGISIPNINPGTATSGTATSQLVPLLLNQSLTSYANLTLSLFEDA